MSHLRTAVLYLVAGCCLLGQDAPPQQGSLDLLTFERFFRAASHFATAPPANGQTTLNGQPTNRVPPSLEDALGITVEEAQLLRTIAADCETNSVAIDKALRPLVQELRFEALAEEPRSESVSRQYNELNRQRTQMVLDHIQELKTALGETRFQRIETFVNARKGNSGTFFGLPPQVVRPGNN